MKGRRFNQQDLKVDLVDVNVGQSSLTKLMLLLFILLFCFLINIPTGYLGGISGFNISIKVDYGFSYLTMNLVLLVWFVAVIYSSLVKSLIVVCLSFLVITLGFIVLAYLNVLELSSTYFILAFFYTLFGLLFCGTGLFAMRFTLALVDILFANPRYLKGVIIFNTVFPASIGANVGATALRNARSDEKIWQAIQALNQSQLNSVTIAAIVTGFIYALAIAIGAWWSNALRGTPWRHPESLRDWSLAIGSFMGTSFYNLDLSNVNFTNVSLSNTDLRAKKLYRTCFQGVKGLERARVDSRYLDLELPTVQKLLTHGCCEDQDFSLVNLRGAYLQAADLRGINFTDTDFIGADLENADLRNANLARAQVIDVDFTSANLTGICIADWSINDQTKFTNVQCDYVFRKLDENGKPTDRFPADRDFEPREFESLYQEVENVVELIFKEGINWRAFAFTLQKLQLEDEGLDLQLKGIEKRGDLWVVKVTHNENVPTAQVERQLKASYEELRRQLANKEQQINMLMGIAAGQTETLRNQSETLKELSKKPFGNSFFITGSTITNLSGKGEIIYTEAAQQVRSIIASAANTNQLTTSAQTLINHLQSQELAMTLRTQTEFIQQVLLTESQKDPAFQQFLLQQGQQIVGTTPESAIASAIIGAIAQLNQS